MPKELLLLEKLLTHASTDCISSFKLRSLEQISSIEVP